MKQKKREYFGTIVKMPKSTKKDSPVSVELPDGTTAGAILSVDNRRKILTGLIVVFIPIQVKRCGYVGSF